MHIHVQILLCTQVLPEEGTKKSIMRTGTQRAPLKANNRKT